MTQRASHVLCRPQILAQAGPAHISFPGSYTEADRELPPFILGSAVVGGVLVMAAALIVQALLSFGQMPSRRMGSHRRSQRLSTAFGSKDHRSLGDEPI